MHRDECVDDECGAILSAHAPSIVLLGNPFEILYTASLYEVSRTALIVHAPRTSAPSLEPNFLAADSEAGRTVDVLVVAKPSDVRRFPMHARWQEAVATMRGAGLQVETATAAASGYLVSQVSKLQTVCWTALYMQCCVP